MENKDVIIVSPDVEHALFCHVRYCDFSRLGRPSYFSTFMGYPVIIDSSLPKNSINSKGNIDSYVIQEINFACHKYRYQTSNSKGKLRMFWDELKNESSNR